MPYKKLRFALLFVCTLVMGLSGCCKGLANGVITEGKEHRRGIAKDIQDLQNGILDQINDWADFFSPNAVTKDSTLTGERKTGADNYVGSYQAEYTDFDNEEYLFGGTAWKRIGGSELKVTYSLEIFSGTAALYWLDKKEQHIIAETSESGTYTFTIHAGENFIVMKGEHFTGTLSLTVE